MMRFRGTSLQGHAGWWQFAYYIVALGAVDIRLRRLVLDMATPMRILAFEVGAYFVRYTVFTGDKPGIPSSIATPTDSAESFYEAIAQVVKRRSKPIDGIALSIPGFVDTSRRRTITAGSLEMLFNHDIAQELSQYVPGIPIWLENDANCVAMAEKLNGNAQNLNDFAVITVGTGIGGALFLDGHIRRGRDWRAGELGMMVTDFSKGGMLPLHDYASIDSLVERYAEEFDVPLADVTATSLFRRLDEPGVRRIVEDWVDYLAVGVFNTVAVIDPECVLIGGPISRESNLVPMLNAALEKNKSWKDFRTTIKRCRHSSNAGLFGAYYAFMTEVAGK